MEAFGVNTLTSDPRLVVFKRHSEYWESIYSVSTASVASLSSVAASLSSSMASPTPTGTLGGGISSSSGQFPAVTTQIITTTLATGGSTLLTTFTTTSLLSEPTSSPTGTTSLSSTFTGSISTTLTTSSTAAPTPQAQIGATDQAVCAGQGLDTQAIGVLTTLIFSAAVGLLIWLIFAILRPRVRSLYGLREWFLAPGLRPPALSNGFFAFLHPPVPLVPSLPSSGDIDDAREARVNPQPGQALADPAQLLAGDEQLAQRTLWVVFLICLVWSFIALAIALPIYLVETPCLPHSGPDIQYGGRYGTLNDLSIMRLLRMLDNGSINGANTSKWVGLFWKRLLDQNGNDLAPNAYGRLIGLCVIIVVLAILPALWKLWKEFSQLVIYHKAWDEGRCEGYEMGYLSCGTGNSALLGTRGGAWGWRGWGEGKVKAFFRKAGLGGGSGLRYDNRTAAAAGNENSALLSPDANGRRRQRGQPSPGSSEERGDAEINVTSVFTVGDTSRLAQLLDERDIILDNLEVAETRYISSFQAITPSPSPSLRSTVPLPTSKGEETQESSSDAQGGFLANLTNRIKPRPDSVASTSSDPNRDLKARISRPRPLKGSYSRSRKGYTPMLAGPIYPPSISNNPTTVRGRGRSRSGSTGTAVKSDKTPTTYLAPSQYYKLNGVRGVSSGRASEENQGENGKNGLSAAIKGRLTGTKFLEVNRDSTIHGKIPVGSRMAVDEQGVLTPLELSKGPNHGAEETLIGDDAAHDDGLHRYSPEEDTIPEDNEMVLVNDASEIPTDHFANPSRARPRPPKANLTTVSRDTFPMRTGRGQGAGREEEPPHLRVQAQQPFHRPISGLDHDALGAIYTDIRHWRGALKAINKEIADAQEQGYEDLAQGRGIKGWILVGKGLRFLPGVEMIEGRSKEDIRWDEIQRGGGFWSNIAFWTAVFVIGMFLGIGLLAAAGLALATSPDLVHYLPFLSPVVAHNNIPSGLATALAPAVAASIFVGLAMFGIHRAARHSGSVSVTVVRIKAFKAVFWVIVIVAGVWLVAAASLLFGAHALDQRSNEAPSIANGSIAVALLLLLITINIAIIVPGLLLLQPVRLWKQYRRKKKAVTPRQHFRAVYPQMYNPVYAMGCCILGIVFVAAFAVLFPLIAPAVLLLVLLTLVAHRYLVGYVYGRTDSGQTGGLLQLWVIRRFATLLALQPILLGLILMAHRKWILGGIMVGIAVVIVILVEWYCYKKLKKPGLDTLSPITRDAVDAYIQSARPAGRLFGSEKNGTSVSSETKGKGRRAKKWVDFKCP
ncbi:SubName: Full=Uncharacterized protein {ECO:0000313/EMBL:CCA69647.1} [Serendipita indica DSM 11827]|nr:SubName: Full=Uncharacterized protein {ECO:0000313/EMBL:CCA69647.1} [Serendipita indica DSM 11827]